MKAFHCGGYRFSISVAAPRGRIVASELALAPIEARGDQVVIDLRRLEGGWAVVHGGGSVSPVAMRLDGLTLSLSVAPPMSAPAADRADEDVANRPFPNARGAIDPSLVGTWEWSNAMGYSSLASASITLVFGRDGTYKERILFSKEGRYLTRFTP
jgi:hypothetical protein